MCDYYSSVCAAITVTCVHTLLLRLCCYCYTCAHVIATLTCVCYRCGVCTRVIITLSAVGVVRGPDTSAALPGRAAMTGVPAFSTVTAGQKAQGSCFPLGSHTGKWSPGVGPRLATSGHKGRTCRERPTWSGRPGVATGWGRTRQPECWAPRPGPWYPAALPPGTGDSASGACLQDLSTAFAAASPPPGTPPPAPGWAPCPGGGQQPPASSGSQLTEVGGPRRAGLRDSEG